MADEDIVIRISAQNLTKGEFDKARKQLQDFGKQQGFVGGTTKKLTSDLDRGLNAALQRTASRGGIATSALAKIGPVGLAAAAAATGLGLAFRSLINESERVTKESEKLKISTDDYQKSLGITIPLTNQAIQAGTKLGKAWDNLATSGSNLTGNTLAPMAERLAKVLNGLVAVQTEAASIDFAQLLPFANNPAQFGAILANQLAAAGEAAAADAPKPFVGPATPSSATQLRNAIETRERLAKEAAEAAEKASKRAIDAEREFQRELEKSIDILGLRKFAISDAIPGIAIPNLGGSRFPGLTANLPGVAPGPVDPFSAVNAITGRGRLSAEALAREAGFDLSDAAEEAEVSLGDLNQQMQTFAHLADVLGPKWAAAFQGLSLGLSGIEGIEGGIDTLGDTTGILGTLKGVAGIAGGIGAIAAPIISLLQGLGGPDIGRDVGRDIGADISEELEKAIEESGQNAQLFLREIFEEGDLGLDKLAEEVGDLFSFFERGEISESGLLGELDELLPILIENFGELGPAGEESLERIQRAAEAMGFDLGIAGDQLERLQKGIPELTLEGFQQKFDLSAEQTAGLQGLGLNLQTDVQRIADDLNVPLNILEGLGPALENLGVSFTELPDFLEATGLSIQDLFEKIGIPPEIQASFDEFTASLGSGIPGEGADPAAAADATGLALANHLGPGLDAGFSSVNSKLDALGATILRGIENLLAQRS